MKKILSSILSVFMIMLIATTMYSTVFAENETGWVKQDGKWYYYSSYGYMYSDGKYQIDGKWYWFDENGVMLQNIGWYKEQYEYGGSTWYYINADGSLMTGWLHLGNIWYWFDEYGYMAQNTSANINGKIYCFDKSGAMVEKAGWYSYKYEDIYTEWYYLNADGTAITGWKQIGNTWYYFEEEYGYMCTGSARIGDKVYMFDDSGAWIKPAKGWYKRTRTYNFEGGTETYTFWYYFKNNDGLATTGWEKIGNTWYYFGDTGVMYTGQAVIKNKVYFFRESGAWYTPAKGWYKVEETYEGEKYTNWYYIENDGTGATGWRFIGNVWYYFNEYSGSMYSDGVCDINGKAYCFSQSGAMMANYYYRSNSEFSWRFFGADGSEQEISGWRLIQNKWYYFDDDGWMYRNTTAIINGKAYCFDKTGAMIDKVGWISFERIHYFYEKGEYVNRKVTEWYYVKNTNGELATGWELIKGKWYYFHDNGWMYSNELVYEYDENAQKSVYYAVDYNGAMITNGWFENKYDSFDGEKYVTVTEWYYLGENGKAVTNDWRFIKNVWYHFNYSGEMDTDEIIHEYNDETGNYICYAVNSSGAMMVNSWFEEKYSDGTSNWYYFGGNGKAVTGWQNIGSHTFYFDTGYRMVTGEQYIDGEMYYFDDNGYLQNN